ncbi:hypothetical protein [Luteolibacter sp. LG18]|uniref:DUF883 family protein n=1 Tax=Luteolibacter sp. LG18 TaxID=2819286 RepID=UPI002B2FA714|nr:hypothetical protein llg_28960 [Luteolibacter sp. LG18]
MIKPASHIKDQAREALDDVKDHARQAADDVRGHAREIADEFHDGAGSLRERASGAIQRATGAVRDTGAEIRARGLDAADHVRDFVRDRPVSAIIGFTAFGFALGYLLRPAPKKSGWFDSSDLADVLTPLRKQARSRFEDLRGRGSDVIGAVQGHLPDHPLDAAIDRARSFGKNLKFW